MTIYGPGWHSDPYGRFAQRYFDGTRWTEHVLDSGQGRHSDQPGAADPGSSPLGSDQFGLQPPGAPPAPAATPFGSPPLAAQPYGWPGAAAPHQPQGPAFSFTVGILVAGVGAILMVLSLFALDFVRVTFIGGLTLTDVKDLVDLGNDLGADEDTNGAVVSAYATGGRVLAIAAAGFAIVTAGMPRRSALVLAITAASVAGFFLLWHLLALVDAVGDGVSPALGAFVGVVGWVALGVGALLRKPISSAGSAFPTTSATYGAPGPSGPPGPPPTPYQGQPW